MDVVDVLACFVHTACIVYVLDAEFNEELWEVHGVEFHGIHLA